MAAGVQVRRGPLHPPLQPPNFQPFAATAFSRNAFPAANVLLHAGEHVTFPSPIEDTWRGMRSGPKRAVTASDWATVTRQVPRPVQAPFHCTNRSVPDGSASSGTIAPGSHCVEHAAVQSRPGISLETLPAPPANAMPSDTCGSSSRCSQSESWMSGQGCECA